MGNKPRKIGMALGIFDRRTCSDIILVEAVPDGQFYDIFMVLKLIDSYLGERQELHLLLLFRFHGGILGFWSVPLICCPGGRSAFSATCFKLVVSCSTP